MDTAFHKKVKNTILFDKYDLFRMNSPENLPAWINTNEDNIVKLLKNYDYPVSSWPVIVHPDKIQELTKLSTKITGLLYQITSLYFKNEVKQIADFYFGGNEVLTTFALMCHEKKIEMASRLDLVYTNNGFKILEVNIGSSIGGWQVQSFESIIKKMHPVLTDANSAHHFQSKNVQLIYMEFLVENILNSVESIDQEINVFFYINHSLGNEVREDSVHFFNELLNHELQKRKMKGRAFSDDFTSLKLKENRLFYSEIPIHGVLILSRDSDTEVPPELFRAFITNKIFLQDHLGGALLGDKRNLALLRELAINNRFSEEDNAFILKSIPWTVLLKKGRVNFEGKDYELTELLYVEKDMLVIKAAKGKQGKNVFVGKYLSTAQWEEVIQEGLNSVPYIVQEFSDSLDFLAPDSTNEWSPHKLIWGSFGFGKRYGGVWVRMSEVKTDKGVINSANGAVEAIVYEYFA